MNEMQPSGRTLDELFECTSKRFYEKNGYYPTDEDILRLTDEARRATKRESEGLKSADVAIQSNITPK